jgi:hypothetical protein
MQTFPYIEDYLELLGGYSSSQSIQIKLARYDNNIVGNMAVNTAFGQSLTDRQAELAVKLVLKYRKQFAKNNIDVTPAENPQYRLALRKVDRTNTLTVVDGMINVRFPYDRSWIDQLHDQRMISCGRMEFDRKGKVWKIAITEPNVKWIFNWASSKSFIIDDKLIELRKEILLEENSDYDIKLVSQGTRYTISNAPSSLITYVQKHCGGFSQSNIINLLDSAGRLGYSVDETVWQQQLDIRSDMRSALEYIGGKQRCYVNPDSTMFNWILDYAKLTDRYPICIYDPTDDLRIREKIIEIFNKKEIVLFDKLGKTSTRHYTPESVKIMYAVKIPTTWNFRVPLLVSTAEMMYGGKRMDLIQRAEKVIYYCNKMRDVE